MHNNMACVAFDLMTVNLQDLPHLPRVLAPLRHVFADELEELTQQSEEAEADGE